VRHLRKSRPNSTKIFEGRHRIEHWYIDNQVYFITARCREKYAAFAAEEAKSIFWDRFNHYTRRFGFIPFVTSLMDNHYHTLGYLKFAKDLGPMMRHIHGSVAKLVNDTLEKRRVPFWCDAEHDDYFDGCIRSEKQCRRAYRYTLTQSVRHKICADWKQYAHTHVGIDLERAVGRAKELKAFLIGVPYKRYETRGLSDDRSGT
jgi:hypothetical protein